MNINWQLLWGNFVILVLFFGQFMYHYGCHSSLHAKWTRKLAFRHFCISRVTVYFLHNRVICVLFSEIGPSGRYSGPRRGDTMDRMGYYEDDRRYSRRMSPSRRRGIFGLYRHASGGKPAKCLTSCWCLQVAVSHIHHLETTRQTGDTIHDHALLLIAGEDGGHLVDVRMDFNHLAFWRYCSECAVKGVHGSVIVEAIMKQQSTMGTTTLQNVMTSSKR